MSDHKNHINRRIKILRYLKGEATSQEEHEIEKRALEDPFEQEAMEGLESQHPDLIESDLKKLSSKINLKKSYKLTYRIAAVVAMLLIFSAIWIFIPESEDATIAQKEDESLEKKKIPKEIPKEPESKEQISQEKTSKKDNEKETASPVKSSRPEIAEAKPQPAEKKTIAEEDQTRQMEVPKSEPADPAKVADSGDQDPAVASKVKMAREEENAMGYSVADVQNDQVTFRSERIAVPEEKNKVFGKVLTPEGEALPGVNVMIKETGQGTITDREGNYQLEVPEDAELVVSFVGLTTEEVAVNSRDTVNVVLSKDIQSLSEVVVTNENKDAGPKGGMDSFEAFVKENLREVKGNPGTVTLEVSLNKAGEIQDIQVVNSLTEQQDQEAIRLVKEYPGFTPKIRTGKARASVVKLSIKFD